MTDITYIQRVEVRNIARIILDKPYDHSVQACELASFILATVDTPAPTLAEELREWAKARLDEEPTYEELVDLHQDVVHFVASAEQMEHDLAEARAEVERLAAERLDRNPETKARVKAALNNLEQAETVTVERTSKESLPVDQGSNYLEKPNSSFKSSLKEPAQNPADVPPREPWLICVGGREALAVRDGDPFWPWSAALLDGEIDDVADESVTLVSRLVPAPRVITNPDELDTLPHNSVILSADNDAWQKSSQTNLWASAWWTTSDGEPSMWASCRLCDEDHPVTVLWDPEA